MFDCSAQWWDDVVVVTPAGDVDSDTAPELRQVLQDVVASIDARGRGIDVDMREVDYLDSVGIGVLVAAHRAAAERGVTLGLFNVGPIVRMVLEITNLLPTLLSGVHSASSAPVAAHRPRAAGSGHNRSLG